METLVLHAETPSPTNAAPSPPLSVQIVPSGNYSTDPEEGAKERAYEALNLMNNNNVEGALKLLDDAIAVYPDGVMSYVLRAEIHERRKEWDAAEKDMDSALKLRPENPLVQMNAADLKLRRGQFGEARTRYKAIATSPRSADLLNYKLFLCDLGEKKTDAATQDLAAFTDDSTPGYGFAHAAWLLDQGKAQEAVVFIKAPAQHLPHQALVPYLAGLDWLGYLPLLKVVADPDTIGI